MSPILVGICGATCSGKTTICSMIGKYLNEQKCSYQILSQDRYYKGGNNQTNYDIPQSIDFKKLVNDLNCIKKGVSVDIPKYDFKTHSRLNDTSRITPTDIILVEGILIFTHKPLLDMFDIKIYIDATKELRYERRVNRDVVQRGRSVDEVTLRYFRDVVPSNQKYVEPSKNRADIILENSGPTVRGFDKFYKTVSSILKNNNYKKSL